MQKPQASSLPLGTIGQNAALSSPRPSRPGPATDAAQTQYADDSNSGDQARPLAHLGPDPGVSLNKLIDELATIALAQHDAEMRFRTLAAKGSTRVGLALLSKLDKAFSRAR